MSYHLKVLRDYPILFYPLDETSSGTLKDISGCENHSTISSIFPFENDHLPFVPGGKNSKVIGYQADVFSFQPTKNYNGVDVSGPLFGTYSTSDNDFSIEFWIKPLIVGPTSKTNILRDGVGGQLFDHRIEIFIDDNKLCFSVFGNDYLNEPDYGYYEVSANMAFAKKAMHVVAIYSVNNISLYIDGTLQQSKELPKNFKFLGSPPQLNSTTEIKTLYANTYETANKFILDNIAIYRYSLSSETVLSHYFAGVKQTEPIQIVTPDKGHLFSLNATKLIETMTYAYPANKSLQELTIDSPEKVYYDQASKSLKFYSDVSVGDKVTITDFISLPQSIAKSSKIEWRGDYEIEVETSSDGTTYMYCKNNGLIPQYFLGYYATSNQLYLRITFTKRNEYSSFSFMGISFYRDKRFYSDNSGDYIEPATGRGYGDRDYSLGSLNYPVLSHHENNGLRMITTGIENPGSAVSTGGFTINSQMSIQTIEFMYTPHHMHLSGRLVSVETPSTSFGWNYSGVINKTNISKIFVNGVDKTSSTNISNLFAKDRMAHVVITFTSALSSPVYINESYDGSDEGWGGLFNNIAIYDYAFSDQKALDHFNLIISKPSTISVDQSVELQEKHIDTYNSDLIVIPTV